MTSLSSSAADTIAVIVNGEPRTIPASTTLRDLITDITGHALNADGSRHDGGRLGVAAAVDSAVVPRSRWASHQLVSETDIEIVTAVQGG